MPRFIQKNQVKTKYFRSDCSLPVDLIQDLEDFDEEVDNVQVELNGGHDVLLWGQPMHDHVRVKNNES